MYSWLQNEAKSRNKTVENVAEEILNGYNSRNNFDVNEMSVVLTGIFDRLSVVDNLEKLDERHELLAEIMKLLYISLIKTQTALQVILPKIVPGVDLNSVYDKCEEVALNKIGSIKSL
jgi:hypothetical protein